LKGEHPIIGDVRGLGLLLAIELVSNRKTKTGYPPEARLEERLTEKFRQQGLVLRADRHVVSFGPPLCITRAEIDEIISGVDRAVGEMEKELSVAQ
jgi:adenosylmethionine-8-amino-7-oxononanoate aminotransferase